MVYGFHVSSCLVVFALWAVVSDVAVAGEQPAADPNWFALEPVKDNFGSAAAYVTFLTHFTAMFLELSAVRH